MQRKKSLRKAASLCAGVPSKYLSGLDADEREKRCAEIKRGAKTESGDPSAYDASKFTTDFKDGKRRKTKPSTYTEEFYALFPRAKSLQQKADATGVPVDILRQVYNRGLAAYRTGHRPGATQGQWAAARVHSFLVKGCTFYFPDHKLAAQAMERSERARKHFSAMQCSCKKGCKSGSRSKSN